MTFLYKPILIAGACLTMCACENFESHPYSVRLPAPVGIHERNIPQIQAKADADGSFSFAFLTDTQGSYDDMRDALDRICSRGDIDFIVHGGDQTDFGLPKEFLWCRDLFECTGIPYIMVLGNHDCVGNGDDTFRYIYGEPNFSFNIGHTHFICLNTVALEYDYSRPVPDLGFIESDAALVAELNANKPDSITHTIVAMHSRPYDDQFNNNVAKPFGYYLQNFPGMMQNDDETDGIKNKAFCINGHNHSLAITDIFENGILYYQAPNIAKRMFMVFTVTKDGYTYDAIEF